MSLLVDLRAGVEGAQCQLGLRAGPESAANYLTMTLPCIDAIEAWMVHS
jgi:hypothetical protein